ncbi:LysR substrate-binding domain-containing protein [Acidipropionibacterium virtanenii]|uniref:Putative HTH-type transcriptional regulator n=1 Tax=Acidipropionibacterium virtanenii TaxID=2057246 RepID=A0A344UYA7_9ACTN|nr:LysR substrate-binding domain-containing protein [Acidipropionibacterium virtanenii]AXE40255.1 putative HTH-type transcriptional regulator [Acidipropionibacterium virtanenii]
MRDPDPSVLRILAELARQEAESGRSSIGSVARSLGLAQPNVSRALRVFEKERGVQVVERSPAGSRLTDDGRAVASAVEPVLEAYRNLEEILTALRRHRSASVRVSASLTVAEYVLPPILLRFRRHRPDVEVSLRMENSEHVLERIRERGADLGFIESFGRPRDVHYRTFDHDELVIVALPGHQRADGPPLTAEELAGLPLLVRERGSGTRTVIDRAIPGGARVAAELPSASAIRTAAATGRAPAAISRLAVAEQLRTGALIELPLDPRVRLARPLKVVWARGRLPEPASLFLQEVLGPPGSLSVPGDSGRG